MAHYSFFSQKKISMKKKLLLAALLFFATSGLYAQNTLGVRVGVFGGYDIEVSFQATTTNGGLEFDLGPCNHQDRDFFDFIGLYQWRWDVGHGFCGYLGCGPSLRIYTDHDTEYNPLGIGVAAQAGISYQLPIPLQLSLDLRPSTDIFNLRALYWSFALSARYRF